MDFWILHYTKRQFVLVTVSARLARRLVGASKSRSNFCVAVLQVGGVVKDQFISAWLRAY